MFNSTTNELLEYSKAVLRGGWNAASDTAEFAVDAITQPEIIWKPIATLAYDAAIIAYVHLEKAQRSNLNAGIIERSPSLPSNLNVDSYLYKEAVKRMERRIHLLKSGIKKGITTFEQGSGPKKVEMLSYTISSILVPGTVYKSVQATSNLVRRIDKWHTLQSPKLFHNSKMDDLLFPLQPVKTLSFNEIRKFQGTQSLIYVILEDGTPVFAKSTITSPLLDVYGNHIIHHIHHPQLAKMAPVRAAGTITVENGYIRRIDNLSGHYKPSDKKLGLIVERSLYEAGFHEAHNKFYQYRFNSLVPPIVTQESLGFNLDKLTLGWGATLFTAQQLDKSNKQKNRAMALRVHSSKLPSNSAINDERQLIKETGTEEEKVILQYIENLEASQALSQPSVSSMTLNEKLEQFYKSQEVANVASQASQLALRFDKDLGVGLGLFSYGAQVHAALTQLSMGMTLGGLGGIGGAINGILSLFDEEEDDNRFQLLFQELQLIRQDIFQLSQYVMQMFPQLFIYLEKKFIKSDYRLGEIIHHQQRHTQQQTFNDLMTHEGIYFLIDQSQKNCLTESRSYGVGKRPLPLSALSKDTYYKLMACLVQIGHEAHSPVINGRTIYSGVLKTNLLSASHFIETLYNKGTLYGYLAAEWLNTSSPANPNIWGVAAENYLQLVPAQYPYDSNQNELKQWIDQGLVFLSVYAELMANASSLLSEHFIPIAQTLLEISTLNLYEEKLTNIVNGNFWQIDEVRRQLNNMPSGYRNLITMKHFHIYNDNIDYPYDCIKDFYALQYANLGYLTDISFSRVDPHQIIPRLEEEVLVRPRPTMNFVYNDGRKVAVSEIIRNADNGRELLRSPSYDHGRVYMRPDEFVKKFGYGRSIAIRTELSSSACTDAATRLNEMRRSAVQQKLSLIHERRNFWEENLTVQLAKIKQLCLGFGVFQSVCDEIPEWNWNITALTHPYEFDLFEKERDYRAPLPIFQSHIKEFEKKLQLFQSRVNNELSHHERLYNPYVTNIQKIVIGLDEQLINKKIAHNLTPPSTEEELKLMIQSLMRQTGTLTDRIHQLETRLGGPVDNSCPATCSLGQENLIDPQTTILNLSLLLLFVVLAYNFYKKFKYTTHGYSSFFSNNKSQPVNEEYENNYEIIAASSSEMR